MMGGADITPKSKTMVCSINSIPFHHGVTCTIIERGVSEMDEKIKQDIDSMDYESMLRRWRYAPVGDPIFQGEVGKYYSEVMKKKRKEIGNDAHVRASKKIGWD